MRDPKNYRDQSHDEPTSLLFIDRTIFINLTQAVATEDLKLPVSIVIHFETQIAIKMDALSKQKKDEYATAFAILALYDGGAEVTSEQITTLLEATGNTEVEAFYPIIYANFLSDPAKIGEMIASPGVGGGTL